MKQWEQHYGQKYPHKGWFGRAESLDVNLNIEVNQMMKTVYDILKSEFPKTKINFKPREKFMPERGTLSIKKAKDLLGYEPKNPIEKGYIKYIRWYKKFWKNL